MGYKYFSTKELACPCGCNGTISQEFMEDIVIPMRKQLGFAFTVPKGGAYRCEAYDGKSNGAHQGHALDILTNSRQRYQIIEWIMRRNTRIDKGILRGRKVTRIGINNGSIHIDDMQSEDGKATDVMWDYYR